MVEELAFSLFSFSLSSTQVYKISRPIHIELTTSISHLISTITTSQRYTRNLGNHHANIVLFVYPYAAKQVRCPLSTTTNSPAIHNITHTRIVSVRVIPNPFARNK